MFFLCLCAGCAIPKIMRNCTALEGRDSTGRRFFQKGKKAFNFGNGVLSTRCASCLLCRFSFEWGMTVSCSNRRYYGVKGSHTVPSHVAL